MDGPLMLRDVERLDRQDDRAAARLLSSAVLRHLSTHHPEWVGLGIYLFVMGGLFAAWQNRTLPHRDRLKLVLRARYFLRFWRDHIVRHPHHSTTVNFISRESFDILMILCDSFLKLVRLHRDLYPSYPFLPWLYSTEFNEHYYGVARYLKKDFTFLDFIQLIPKMTALLLGAFATQTHQASSNSSAAGYEHTHFKGGKIDVQNLRSWPQDLDVDDAAEAAAAEAIQLLRVCGVYNPAASDADLALHEDDPELFEGTEDIDLQYLIGEDEHDPRMKESSVLSLLSGLQGPSSKSTDPALSEEFSRLSYAGVGSVLAGTQAM